MTTTLRDDILARLDELKLEPHERAALIPLRPILIVYRGSIAHGTYLAPTEASGIDDVDLMGVYIPGLEHYFGHPRTMTGLDKKIREYDMAAYEFRHFCSLLLKGNPNVLSMLWTADKHRLLVAPEAQRLIDNREMFLSRVVYHSFSGYAYSQLKRMTAITGATEGCCAGEKFHDETCPLRETLGRGSSKKFATGFMGAKRKGLVERFGYDCKNAAHLIRLLRMGIETLRERTIYTDRTDIDAAQLIEIKTGQWPVERVNAEAERLFAEMKAARDETTLPETADMGRVEDLMVDILSVNFASDCVLRNHMRGKSLLLATHSEVPK